MKKILIALSVIVLLGCSDKSVLLPEVQNATITEITDVSPAYIFYDETKPDSLELNKGNLIISTNWLVNVDKRLTLKQVIPSIIELQEKKRNSSHKNESARNYYTCNDTSIKNLGFIDFTDVVYIQGGNEFDEKGFKLLFGESGSILIHFPNNNNGIFSSSDNLVKEINSLISDSKTVNTFVLVFNENISFQEYINLKSILSGIETDKLIISKSEFIGD